MKRNILYIGMLLAALIVFSACDEAMESNLPAEYATVLYFQGSGEVDVDMTNVEEGEVTYRLIICKGGNQLGGTASARIIMTVILYFRWNVILWRVNWIFKQMISISKVRY